MSEIVWGFEVADWPKKPKRSVEPAKSVLLPDGEVVLTVDAFERARAVGANPEDFAAQVRAEARDAAINWDVKLVKDAEADAPKARSALSDTTVEKEISSE